MKMNKIAIMFAALTLSLGFTACGSSSAPAKGGGSKGATDNKVKGTPNTSQGQAKGQSYLGVECNAANEGVAWCDSETDLAFCTGGAWYILDCAHPDIDGDFCAEDEDVIGCFAADDF